MTIIRSHREFTYICAAVREICRSDIDRSDKMNSINVHHRQHHHSREAFSNAVFPKRGFKEALQMESGKIATRISCEMCWRVCGFVWIVVRLVVDLFRASWLRVEAEVSGGTVAALVNCCDIGPTFVFCGAKHTHVTLYKMSRRNPNVPRANFFSSTSHSSSPSPPFAVRCPVSSFACARRFLLHGSWQRQQAVRCRAY